MLVETVPYILFYRLRREAWQIPSIEQLLYQTDKSSNWRCSIKKNFQKNFAVFTAIPVFKALVGQGWNKVTGREAPTQIFSCEYCKISSNTCFEEHLRTTPCENNNKKRFLGKTTGHNDHYMINMGGQRSQTGGNWPLTNPYLQRYF